jgi:polyhydroxybutyrate depolymerase
MTAVSDTPQIDSCNVEFEGHLRRYMMFVPKDYSGEVSYPLVISLHGYGWTATDEMYYTMLHQVAEANDYLVVYPSGNPNWNSGIGNDPNWPTPDINDVGYIDALLDTLSNFYNIDQGRIYAAGFSNGGRMAYRLACQLSDRIAAVASVAGVLSTDNVAECNPSHPMPVLYVHGTDDTLVGLDSTPYRLSVDQTVSYWTEFNNCTKMDSITLPDIDPDDDSTVEKYSYTACDNDSSVVFYKVINGGHSWPGAELLSWTGATNQDFNASEEILNFFNNYQLP